MVCEIYGLTEEKIKIIENTNIKIHEILYSRREEKRREEKRREEKKVNTFYETSQVISEVKP